MLALLIILCVCLYVLDASTFLLLAISYDWPRYVFYIAAAAAIVLASAIIIVSAVKKPHPDKKTARLCLIIKCALLPHYALALIFIAAFALTGVVFLGFFPISIAFGLVVLAIFAFNYFIMVATGMPLICSLFKNKAKRGVWLAVHILAQLCFIADLVDVVFLTVAADENRMPPPPPPPPPPYWRY